LERFQVKRRERGMTKEEERSWVVRCTLIPIPSNNKGMIKKKLAGHAFDACIICELYS
jgi:hypothetical protein